MEKKINWNQIYTNAENQLKMLNIDSEYVCVNQKTSSHGEKYSEAFVTIRMPVKNHKKEIEILMQQNNFCKLRGENSNGVRYMRGWLIFNAE